MGVKVPTFSEVNNTYENAHGVIKGNPAVNGPYLDDIERAQELEYRARRTGEINAAAKAKKANASPPEKKAKKSEAKKTTEEVATPVTSAAIAKSSNVTVTKTAKNVKVTES